MAVGWILDRVERIYGVDCDIWRRTERVSELTSACPDNVVLDAETLREFKSIRRERLRLPAEFNIWGRMSPGEVEVQERSSVVVHHGSLGSGEDPVLSEMVNRLEHLVTQTRREVWTDASMVRVLLGMPSHGGSAFDAWRRGFVGEWALSPTLVASYQLSIHGEHGQDVWRLTIETVESTADMRRDQKKRMRARFNREPSLKHMRRKSAWCLFAKEHMSNLEAEAGKSLPGIHRSKQDEFGRWFRYEYSSRRHRLDCTLYTLGRYAYMARLEGGHREYVKSIDGFLQALRRLEWGPGRRTHMRVSMVFFADGVGRDVHKVFHPEFIRSVNRFADAKVPVGRKEQRALAETVRDMHWNQAMSY